ncbi:MAG: hypothetical protein KatS3mg040_1709 [Candidatus Kapaibacterium sp.]|nr:MAG: hypothetical protein KatS3mg040_1709 [Candidatus Kapabacteria bacterium]
MHLNGVLTLWKMSYDIAERTALTMDNLGGTCVTRNAQQRRDMNVRALRADNRDNADLGFKSQLWAAANALRGSMDAAEYKHVVLGLIFLKYISDAFEELHARLEAERARLP